MYEIQNDTCEEILWRGLFVKALPKKIILGFIVWVALALSISKLILAWFRKGRS